jgi:hypothetical protein
LNGGAWLRNIPLEQSKSHLTDDSENILKMAFGETREQSLLTARP